MSTGKYFFLCLLPYFFEKSLFISIRSDYNNDNERLESVMKKSHILLLSVPALLGALGAGYFFSRGDVKKGVLFAVISGVLLLVLLALSNASKRPGQDPPSAYAGRLTRDVPSINLAFFSGLSRLIDEGKDTGEYLRGCDAPRNMIKSVNIGGATTWYYHRDDMEFDEFRADFAPGEACEITHPYLKAQHIETTGDADIHYITVDLYRALWDWGEKHPEKKKYANSMRMAFQGAYTQKSDDENSSFLDKTIEEVKAERKAFKKNPNKKKRRKSG